MAINQARLSTTGETTVYTSSGVNAIVTIAVCNTGAPTAGDESINSCTLDLYLVSSGDAPDTPGKSGAPGTYSGNQIVSSLTVPAGETVFFSDEKIVLDNGDYVVAQASSSNLLSITVSTLVV
jgi:hypothetical protein